MRYLEENTNAGVVTAKIVNDQAVGTEVIETALDVRGYDLVSADTPSLVLRENDNLITFYYRAAKKLVSYIAYYVALETGKELCPSKTVTGLEVGEIITEYTILIDGYTPIETEKIFSLDEVGNYVYFIYYSTIEYSENESENVIETEAVEVQEAPADTEAAAEGLLIFPVFTKKIRKNTRS